ncbi:hypothetical protein [Rothia dentocariosa]|uniref:hypothetical protein n=1 Tax=Rothia dentocariosa TaxID=2047 RepID=UPI0001E06C9B|nr:hypothetical protein [Rothia dentocariosa]EFJ77353.1 hypothetical protein HMPREF0734_00398 [Rothia dentocariosa M567]QKI09272.1 hypothetical protein FOC60_05065 [Rothia dentocariosa]
MDLVEVYENVYSQSKNCMNITFENHRSDYGNIHYLENILFNLLKHTNRINKNILEYSIKEIGFSGYCVATGLYGQAFSSVRKFLETGFASVFYSVHEYEYDLWVKGQKDYSWKKGLEGIEGGNFPGLFSKQFIYIYNKDLYEESSSYKDKAKNVYRECSEYMHGKISFSLTITNNVVYNKDLFDKWNRLITSALESVIFLLLIRYGNIINNQILSDDEIDSLNVKFGHHRSVRKMIGIEG